jgi:hypothetical protein
MATFYRAEICPPQANNGKKGNGHRMEPVGLLLGVKMVFSTIAPTPRRPYSPHDRYLLGSPHPDCFRSPISLSSTFFLRNDPAVIIVKPDWERVSSSTFA